MGTLSTSDPDQIFRLILLAGMVLVFPMALYYRVRSQATGEKLDRRQEGLFILATLRPLGMLSAIGLLAFAANPSWMAWSSVPIPVWLRGLGVPIGAAAGALIFWTFHTLGPNLTDTVVTRIEHSLVTSGPYGWVRHPFYVAFLLAMAGNSLITANWFIALTGSLAFILIVIRTNIEERKLVERFGEEYVTYMEQTPRFWPRPSRDG